MPNKPLHVIRDYAHGARLVVADTPVGRLGLTVCYDLRFPALYSALRAAGAELISTPSAFTAVTGEAHWRSVGARSGD